MLLRAWLAPTPSPFPPLRGVGRGGGLASWVLPGNSEQGRGVALASLFNGLEWRLIWAEENRVFISRSKRASQAGGFIQRVNLASSFSGFLEKEKKSNRKEKKSMYIL
jgi:hypothetical protein